MDNDDDSFLSSTQESISRFSRNVALVASAVMHSDEPVSVTAPSQYHRAMSDVVGYKKRIVASQIKELTPRQMIQQSLLRRLGGTTRAPELEDQLLLNVPEPRTQHSLFQTFGVTVPNNSKALPDPAFSLSVRKEMAASELLEIDDRISSLRGMRKLVFERMADVEHDQVLDERTLQHYYPRGEQIRSFVPKTNSSIKAVDFNSPFGQLALAFGNEIALYELNGDTDTRLRGRLAHPVECLSVANVDPVVCCGASHSIYVWRPDAQTNTFQPEELGGHVDDVLVVDNDGESLVTSSLDLTVRNWDLKVGKCTTIIDMFEYGVCGALQHTQNALATGTSDGVVRLFDLRESSTKHSASRSLQGGHTKPITSLYFNGLELASGSEDGSLRVWDLRNGQISTAEAYPGPVQSVQFDAAKVVASVGGDLGVRVLSRATNEHRISAMGDSPITSSRYMKGYLVTGRSNGSVSIWAV